MTHKALNQPWSNEEIALVRNIMNGNPDLKPGEKIAKAADAVNRTPNAVQFKWYTHIAKIRLSDESIIEPLKELPKEQKVDKFIKTKTVQAYIGLTGQVFLKHEDALNSNINYILEEMENTDNLYTYITENKEYVEYLISTKK
jgi:hypothetical protein